jgi:hypothetical protein
MAPDIYYSDHFPGAKSIAVPMFERVLANETIREDAQRFESGGIVSHWEVVLAPLAEDGKVVGILNVTVDTSGRVEAQQNLENHVQERTRELATLLQVSHDVNSTLELQPLMDLILEQLRSVLDYSGASILLLEGTDLALDLALGSE